MAKELPYFQFEPAEYMAGSIQFCSIPAQGLFVNIMSLYWQRECQLTLEQVRKRFNYPDLLEELINENIIKVASGKITIKFLLNQKNSAIDISKKRSKSGKKGMNTRWNGDNKTITSDITNPLQTDNKSISIKEDNIREDNITTNVVSGHPLRIWISNTQDHVSKLKTQLSDREAERLVKKYDKAIIKEVVEQMNNHAPLLKKYKSVYSTIDGWIKAREKKNPGSTQKSTKEDHSARNDFYDHLQAI